MSSKSAPPAVSMDAIVALAKRRGFIFQSSEIYGGLTGFFDYGPLGVELKKNIRDCWWNDMVRRREDVVGPEPPHDVAALRLVIEQALGREQGQRRPQGRARDAEALGQGHLLQPLARRHGPVQDPAAQDLRHVLGSRSHHGYIDGHLQLIKRFFALTWRHHVSKFGPNKNGKGTAVNRIALVTGGGRGIGQEVCRVLAEAGLTVADATTKAAELTKQIRDLANAGK